MLVVRVDTTERLVVGITRFKDCLGLFFCGNALLVLSIILAIWTDPSLRVAKPGVSIILLLYYVYFSVLFGIGGIFIIFSQRKLIFDLPTQQLLYCRGMGTPATYALSAVRCIELRQNAPGYGQINLVLEGGGRLIIDRGPPEKLHVVALRVSNFIRSPLEMLNFPVAK